MPCPAAAPATWCTASTRSSTRSTAASRTATSPAATRSGLTMGQYDTKTLPIYQFLHSAKAPELRDRRPVLPGRVRRVVPQPPVPGRGPGADRHQRRSGRSARGTALRASTATASPTRRTRSTTRPPTVNDGPLTQACGLRPPTRTSLCGDYAVNTIQPASPPHGSSAPQLPLIDDTAYPNIGDRLSAKRHLVELVLRRLGRRGGRHPGPAVPVPPPAAELLRELRARTAGPGPPQDETAFIAAAKNGTLPRSASSSRTARRTSTPATPASARQRPPGRPAHARS